MLKGDTLVSFGPPPKPKSGPVDRCIFMILELRRRSRASGKVDAIYYMANKLFYTDLIGTNALDYCGGWLIRFEKREN